MIRILLQSDEPYFVKAFSNYASTNCRNMEFICFSTPEKALEYLSRSFLRFDAVLATPSLLEQISSSKTVCMQTSDHTSYTDPEAIQINIYQSGPAIISDIRNALVLCGHSVLGAGKDRQVHVVASYSTQGGSGKTVVSYALAAAAARRGKQALYLNLEPFPAFAQLYEQDFKNPMDDLLFALKSGRDAAPVVLDTMVRNSDHVMVMPPFSFAGDLLSLTEDQVNAFLDVLIEKTDLDYIFIDLSVGFQPINLWVMAACTTMLQIYTDDEVGREHMNRAASDVYFKNLPIQGAVLTVLNRCKTKKTEEEIAGRIPNSDSLQMGRQVSDVQERNPAFLKSCMDLLEKIV